MWGLSSVRVKSFIYNERTGSSPTTFVSSKRNQKKKIVCPSKQDSEDSVTVTVVVVDQRIISQECVDHLQEVLLSLVSSVRLAGTDRKQKRPVQIMRTQDLVWGQRCTLLVFWDLIYQWVRLHSKYFLFSFNFYVLIYGILYLNLKP